MKVYVVMEDWASDDDNGASIVGVYTTEELAKEKMNKYFDKQEKAGETFATTVKGDWHIDSYTDGFYSTEHECLYIEPTIIDEDLK